VQGPPQDRNVGVGQTLQLHCDRVDVADQQRVVRIGRAGEGCGNVEIYAVGVEATPPLFALDVIETGGGVPVYASPSCQQIVTGG
jgi:hypothetical protein